MKRTLPVPIAACLIVAAGFRAHAGHEPAARFSEPEPGGAGHHAIGEIYDEERTLILAGEVESFLFGNPHSLLHVRVVDGGRARIWAVEWRAADRLSRAGLTGDALAPGDAVTLCGHPGRDPAAYRLYLLNVVRGPAGAGPAREVRAALCEREARPETADLPVRPAREPAAGLAAR